MFTDPQVVTVNAVAQSMARILIEGKKCIYQKSDGTFTLTISHQILSNDRIRSMTRIDQKAVVQNPLDLTNDYDTLSFYFVVDRPSYGFIQAQVEQLIAGLKTWLDNTAIGKLFGQEA